MDHYRFTFGKHKGRTFAQIVDEDIGYGMWAMKQRDTTSQMMLNFIEYATPFVERHLDKKKKRLEPKLSRLTTSDVMDPTKFEEIYDFEDINEMGENVLTLYSYKIPTHFHIDNRQCFDEWNDRIYLLNSLENHTEDWQIRCFRILPAFKASFITTQERKIDEDNEDYPSRIVNRPWVHVQSSSIHHTSIGKWMIFADKEARNIDGNTTLDVIWRTIRKMICDDEFCVAGKCATGYPNPNAMDDDKGVIVIYTCSACIESVKMTLKEKFSHLNTVAVYKYSSDTRKGKYGVEGVHLLCRTVKLQQ